jgi:hypothetical protein
MQGAAAIGAFLLRLAALQCGQATFIKLADSPF